MILLTVYVLNVYKINTYFAKPSGMLQNNKKKKNNKLNQIKIMIRYNIETVIKINVYDTTFILGLYNKTSKTITEFLNFIITLFFF